MPNSPYHPEDWGDCYVSPRYLPLPAFTGEPALAPLTVDRWVHGGDDLGNVYSASEDLTLRVGFIPEGPDTVYWRIAGYRGPFEQPEWMVTFDHDTPVEIVAGLTSALPALYAEGPDAYLQGDGSDLAAMNAATPLAAAGWSHTYATSECVRFDAPDGLARAYLRTGRLHHGEEMRGDRERWLVSGGAFGANRWTGRISSRTPERLVSALFTAMTDPAPLVRYRSHLSRVQEHAVITPLTPRAPTPLDVAQASSARAQAARARSTTQPASARRLLGLPPGKSAPSVPAHTAKAVPQEIRWATRR